MILTWVCFYLNSWSYEMYQMIDLGIYPSLSSRARLLLEFFPYVFLSTLIINLILNYYTKKFNLKRLILITLSLSVFFTISSSVYYLIYYLLDVL